MTIVGALDSCNGGLACCWPELFKRLVQLRLERLAISPAWQLT
jgi:hypothetical protein